MRNSLFMIVVASLFLVSCDTWSGGVKSREGKICPALYMDVCNIDDDREELIKASGDGDIETVKRLLNKKKNVEAIDATVFHLGNHSALSAAIENVRVEVVKFLIDSGASVTHPKLMKLALEVGNQKIIDLLRKALEVNGGGDGN